jgi:hypothetical protein
MHTGAVEHVVEQGVATRGKLFGGRALELHRGVAALVDERAARHGNALTLLDKIEPVACGDDEEIGPMRFRHEGLGPGEPPLDHRSRDLQQSVPRTFIDRKRRDLLAAGQRRQPPGFLRLRATEDNAARGCRARC